MRSKSSPKRCADSTMATVVQATAIAAARSCIDRALTASRIYRTQVTRGRLRTGHQLAAIEERALLRATAILNKLDPNIASKGTDDNV